VRAHTGAKDRLQPLLLDKHDVGLSVVDVGRQSRGDGKRKRFEDVGSAGSPPQRNGQRTRAGKRIF
jgi:hypothetical protein